MAGLAFVCWSLPQAQAFDGPGRVGAPSTVEIGFSGLVDLDVDDPTTVFVDLRLGYFVFEGIEIGATTMIGTNDHGQRDVLGAFSEYDWRLTSRYVPFAGGELFHAKTPRGSTEERGVRGLSAYGGLRMVLDRGVALSLTARWEFADRPFFGSDSTRKRRNRQIDLGLSFYL